MSESAPKVNGAPAEAGLAAGNSGGRGLCGGPLGRCGHRLCGGYGAPAEAGLGQDPLGELALQAEKEGYCGREEGRALLQRLGDAGTT